MCIRPDPAVSMDRQKKIGLHAPRLLYSHLQGHEEIGITGQHSTHVGLGINPGFEAAGNFKRDIFFVTAGLANGAGILATVTGIEGDRNQTINNGLARFLAGVHFRGFKRLVFRLFGNQIIRLFFNDLEILLVFGRLNGLLAAFEQRAKPAGVLAVSGFNPVLEDGSWAPGYHPPVPRRAWPGTGHNHLA